MREQSNSSHMEVANTEYASSIEICTSSDPPPHKIHRMTSDSNHRLWIHLVNILSTSQNFHNSKHYKYCALKHIEHFLSKNAPIDPCLSISNMFTFFHIKVFSCTMCLKQSNSSHVRSAIVTRKTLIAKIPIQTPYMPLPRSNQQEKRKEKDKWYLFLRGSGSLGGDGGGEGARCRHCTQRGSVSENGSAKSRQLQKPYHGYGDGCDDSREGKLS